MAWTTVFVGLIGLSGPLLGAWLQEQRSTTRLEAERRDQHIREGADILARVNILLVDGDPDRLGFNVRREAPFDDLTPLQHQWRMTLRAALAAFALADSSPQVRELGRQLEVAVTNSLISSGWMLRDLISHEGVKDSREQAKSDHAEAQRLATELMAAIRGDG